MIRTIFVREVIQEKFNAVVDKHLEELESDDCEVVDIKLSTCADEDYNHYSALIIYKKDI
jgi:hypothetical protein